MKEQNISNLRFQISHGVRRRVNALGIREVEPWHEPVDGKVLLDELADVLRRFVVLPNRAAETLALWVLHTYAFELRDVSTYIGIESPEKRCGKTTLLAVLSELVSRPVVAANISSPAFFRVIEELRPTLLIDEADTFLQGNDELRGILNSGYARSTAYVVRVANEVRGRVESESGGGWPQRGTEGAHDLNSNSEIRNPKEIQNSNGENSESPEDGHNRISKIEDQKGGRTTQRDRPYQEPGSRLASFSCWCPKIMAAIGRLPETLADRCIVIRMQRKGVGESCERLRCLEAESLRRKCARFVLDHQDAIALARPMVPEELNDRAADIWEPLLVLADIATRASESESESESDKPRTGTPGLRTDGHGLSVEELNAKPEIRNPNLISNSMGEKFETQPDEGTETTQGTQARNRARLGNTWAVRAREAAVALNVVAQESNPIGQLLLDILIVFVKEKADRMFSRTMVQWLNSFSNRTWTEMTRRRTKEAPQGVTDVWLAKVLRPYGIRPMTIRIGEGTGKGYVQDDFMPVFQRYIPRADLEELVASGTKSLEAEGE